MLLKNIADSSNYIAADESINSDKLVGLSNSCIAEINRKTGTKLPFFVTANYDTLDYDAITDDWQLSLIEPYLCFLIMSNDDNSEQRNFHYQRFMDAIRDFKSKGIKDIKLLTSSGEDTGYLGTASRIKIIDPSNRTVNYQRW